MPIKHVQKKLKSIVYIHSHHILPKYSDRPSQKNSADPTQTVAHSSLMLGWHSCSSSITFFGYFMDLLTSGAGPT